MVVRMINRGMSVDVPWGQQHITSGAQRKPQEVRQGIEKKISPFVVHLHRTKKSNRVCHATLCESKRKKEKEKVIATMY